MKKQPKPKDEGIFAHGLGIKVVIQGVMFASLTLAGYYIGQYATIGGITPSEKAGQTMAFFILALCQIVQAYNMRSEHSLFKIGPFTNKNLNIAAITSVVLVALVMFIPGLNTIFGLIYLSWQHYLIGLGLIFVPLLVMEIAKALGVIRHHGK
jgi:Ca2+-transporting ATPase